MLKGIDYRLNADVLYVLRAMGHGDTLVLTDCNFPTESISKYTSFGRLVAMDNMTSANAASAILSVLPLDTFDDDFALRMEVVGQKQVIPAVQNEVQSAIDCAEGRPRPMTGVDRYAFYDLAKQSFALLRTGERRFYGCFIFRKGVIAPDQ